MKFNYKTNLCLFLILLILFSSVSAFASDKAIRFADPGWDSVKFHNAVAGLIVKNVFDYSWSEVPGGTSILHEGMIKGEIDINMETWTDNILTYEDDLSQGKLTELGINFDDNIQGIYVPAYVIKGDEERGIEPIAPDLKHVKDLKKYADIFPDEEDSSRGRLYGAIPGWDADRVLSNKFEFYGLDENFNYFRPGSEAAHDAALTSAYDRGEPIVGYYWEPTWIMGQYDFILLEDEPFDADKYESGATSFPSVRVAVSSSNDFYNNKNNKDVIRFLEKYETSSELTSDALAYMQETGADYEETARWFLSENDKLIDQWLDKEDAELLRDSLTSKGSDHKNFFMDFPFKLSINYDKIDDSVRAFSVKHDKFFGGIRSFLGGLVNIIQNLLQSTPWLIILVLVILAGWKTTRKIRTGIGYGALMFFVGSLGLWNLMLETLSIVIASVIISLALGFPIGILLSRSNTADKIARPILDALQTMPVFVYLIPALLFFGLGKPPAVIATTIYAIVPIIRMTNHGIRGIDKEVVEASISFGATSWQTLIKVQIPQALPTIMAGVNQTLMMAMSMVVTTSMIGATGLGMEVLISVNRIEIGRGLVSGTAVVILAVLLDRITQGFIDNSEVDIDGE